MKSCRSVSLFTHLLVLCGLAGLSLGMPGDIATSPGTVAGGSLDASMEVAGGSANVSPSGAFDYSYPLAVPPGRAGLQPSLALSYSSQGALYGGIAAGWSLSVPDLHRDWSRGHYAPERWVSGLAGGRELIPVIESAFWDVAVTYRAQGDPSYARYQRMIDNVPHRWQVLTPDGLRYEFGNRNGPEIDGLAQLIRVVDGFGNSVDYEWEGVYRQAPYTPETLIDIRLKRISYTRNLDVASGLAPAEVTFDYAPLDWCSGAPVGAQQLWDPGRVTWRGATSLVSIKTWVRPTPSSGLQIVRRWDLDYDASAASCSGSHSPIRLLTEIREVDVLTEAPRVRPGVTFEYGDMTPGLEDHLSVDFQPSTAPDKDVGRGTRKDSTMLDVRWSTVEAQLLDLDADARPDRVFDYTAAGASHCAIRWENNGSAAADVAFGPSAASATVPAIPWANGLPPWPGTMNVSLGEDCSLTGQYSVYSNKQPEPPYTDCDRGPIGNYNAYRFLDMDSDGAVDLVTALQYDPLWFDPGLSPPWPESDPPPPPDLPAIEQCPVLDRACTDAAIQCTPGENGDECTFDWAALDICIANAPREDCHLSQRRSHPIFKDNGSPFDPHDLCQPARDGQMRNEHYIWVWYKGRGDGTFDTTWGNERMAYSPIPLSSSRGETVSASGSVSQDQAIVDLDGDGHLDVVMDAGYSDSQGGYLWLWWRGDGTGRFRGRVIDPGTGEEGPFWWPAPLDSYPAIFDTPYGGGNDPIIAREIGGLYDVNGDGRPDLVTPDPDLGSTSLVYFNTGTGFALDGYIAGVGPNSLFSGEWQIREGEPGIKVSIDRPIDFDADGRIDWIIYGLPPDFGWRMKWNVAGHLTSAPVPAPSAAKLQEVTHIEAAEWWTVATALDVDGDGKLDRLTANPAELETEPRDGTHRALLSKIHNGYGLTTEVTYEAASYGGTVTMNAKRLPSPLWVVASTKNIDAHLNLGSAEERSSYRYISPEWNQDPDGYWGFRGFAETRATGPSGAVSVAKFAYDVDWSGRQVKTEVYASEADRAAGRPASMTETEWQELVLIDYAILEDVKAIHPTRTWRWTCLPGQTINQCRNQGAVLRTVSSYPLVIPDGETQPALRARSQTQYLDQMGTIDDTDWRNYLTYKIHFTETGYRLRPFNEWRQERQAGAWNTIGGRVRHIYDATLLTETRTEVWHDASTVASTIRTFDMGTGNLVTAKKPRQVAAGSPKLTSLAYDAWALGLASVTNEEGHQIFIDYDMGTGQATSVRGPNKKVLGGGQNVWEETRLVYDQLGRVTEVWVSVDDQDAGYRLEHVARTTYDDFASPERIVAEERIDYGGADWITLETLNDGHGRAFQQVRRLFDPALPDAVATIQYDHRGNLVAATTPDPSQFDGGTGVTYVQDFDSLGRRTGARDPHGNGVVVSYAGLVQTVAECVWVAAENACLPSTHPSAPAGEVLATTETTRDVFGRLMQVRERMSDGNWATTNYGYNENGDVIQIVNADPLSPLDTRISYGWQHQRVAMTRAYGTSNARTWTYGYDLNGNLVSEVAPSGSADPLLYTTTYGYDDLDRQRTRLQAPALLTAGEQTELGVGLIATDWDVYPGVPGPAINSTGRITVTRTGGSILKDELHYDAQGRMTSATRSFDLAPAGIGIADSRTIETTYNALGQEVDTTYADGLTRTRKRYDRRGLPTDLEDPLSGTVLARAYHNVAGAMTRFDAGFGCGSKSQRHTYDDLGRLTILQGMATSTEPGCPETTLIAQSFVHGATSEVTQMTSTVQGLGSRTLDFVYDDQHQLTYAVNPTNAADYEAEFAYNPAGKLLSAFVSSTSPGVLSRDVTYEYESGGDPYPDPEAVNVLRGAGGNPVATYLHDSLGNVTSREDAAGTRSFLYDIDAQRRVSMGGATLETYFYDAGGMRALVVEGPAGQVQRVRLSFGESEIWYSGTGAVTDRFTALSHGAPMLRMQDTPDTSEDEVLFTGPLGHTLGAVRYGAANQTLSVGYQYGPYGEILAQTGEADTHLQRFNGKEHDQASGLYYYGFRYFDPLSLRWTQNDRLYRALPEYADTDPRRGNLYQFSLNNPLRYVDRLGLDPWWREGTKSCGDYCTVVQGVADDVPAQESDDEDPYASEEAGEDSEEQNPDEFEWWTPEVSVTATMVDLPDTRPPWRQQADRMKEQLAAGVNIGPGAAGRVLAIRLATLAGVGSWAAASARNAAPAGQRFVGALVTRVGQMGERAVRTVYNIGDKAVIRVNGRVRIPDGVTRRVLSEIKNTTSLSYTLQLRDFVQYAQQQTARGNPMSVEIYVRPWVKVSEPLWQEILAGRIGVHFIP